MLLLYDMQARAYPPVLSGCFAVQVGPRLVFRRCGLIPEGSCRASVCKWYTDPKGIVGPFLSLKDQGALNPGPSNP